MTRENRHRTARRPSPSRHTSSQHRTHRGPSSLRWRDSARSEELGAAEAAQIQRREPPNPKNCCLTSAANPRVDVMLPRALRRIPEYPNNRGPQKYISHYGLPIY